MKISPNYIYSIKDNKQKLQETLDILRLQIRETDPMMSGEIVYKANMIMHYIELITKISQDNK